MVWTPQFSEAGEAEFIDKLMIVVHRDFKQALDYYWLDSPTYLIRYAVSKPTLVTGEDLPDLAARLRGKPSVFVYPLLVLGLERMVSQETINGEWLSQELTVGAGLVVNGTSIEGVQRKCEKYVRAFTAVVRKGVLEMLPAASALVEYTIDISHQYFMHGTKGTEFTQPVEFEIKIRFGEK